MLAVIAERLRTGVDRRSAFDPRSRLIYSIMAFELVLGAIASYATGFVYRLDTSFIAPGLMFLSCAFLLRSVQHNRIAGGFETIILWFFQGLPTIFIIFPLLTISGPYADPWLEKTDKLLGFDWFAFIGFFRGHDGILNGIVWAYRSLFYQPLIVIPALWLTNNSNRAWSLVTALSVALIICLAIYPFAPADAAFTHFGVTRSQFPLSTDIPWTTGPVVHSFKDGARLVTDDSLKGLITFPSYHAAAGAALIWAAWPISKLRIPFVILNAAMFVSCIIVGAHYLIDVLVGIAIGFVTAVIASKLVEWQSDNGNIRSAPII